MEVDEPSTTSHKGEKVRSYTISFKLQVIEYAENHSIAAAAQNIRLTVILFVIGRKTRTCYKKFQLQRIVKRGSA